MITLFKISLLNNTLLLLLNVIVSNYITSQFNYQMVFVINSRIKEENDAI